MRGVEHLFVQKKSLQLNFFFGTFQSVKCLLEKKKFKLPFCIQQVYKHPGTKPSQIEN